jgi:hypothetical protein
MTLYGINREFGIVLAVIVTGALVFALVEAHGAEADSLPQAMRGTWCIMVHYEGRTASRRQCEGRGAL